MGLLGRSGVFRRLRVDEAARFRWATVDEIPDLLAEAYAVRMLDAVALHDAVTVRQHSGTNLI